MILCYGEKLSSGVRVPNDTIVASGSFRINASGGKIYP
jgi:hypothetical protein